MDLVLPSITGILLALAIVIYVFPRLAPVMLAFFAGAALVYGIHAHYMMFGAEYNTMSWVDQLKSFAPQIMVGIVVICLIAYLLFAYGTGRSPTIPSISSRMPSPNSATNSLTENLNTGMRSSGFSTPSRRFNATPGYA